MKNNPVRLAFSMFYRRTSRCHLMDGNQLKGCFLSESADLVIRALRLK